MHDTPLHQYATIEYDMEDFFISCVDRYCELAGIGKANLRAAPAPFIDDIRSTVRRI